MIATCHRNIRALFTLLAAAAAPVLAAEEQAAGPGAAEALALAEKAWQRVLEAEAVSLQLATLFEIKAQGSTQKMESRHDILVQRPGRFAMIGLEGEVNETFVSDGERATLYLPMTQRYFEREAPATVEELLSYEGADGAGGMPTRSFIAPFISGEAFKQVREAVAGAEYLGREERDGRVLHRLALDLSGGAMDWPDELAAVRDLVFRFEVDLGAAGDEPPLVERIHLDMTPFVRATMQETIREHPEMAEMFRDMEMRYTFSFSDWSFPDAIEAARFAFVPPDGAEKVEEMEEIFGQPRVERETKHELLGAAAPEFELKMLDGSTARLSDHLGEKVIVLDFWATWCGPCIQAMPTLIEVTDKYRDRGVVFWAINLRETPEQVRRFIEAREWKLQVPMDSQGAIAERYRVTGIPQTVIIGKDKTVQAVHVGFSPSLRDTLPVELETLLSGRRLEEATAH